MPFTDSGRNSALDGLAASITHLAVLDASATELTGGTYARLASAWASAGSGQVASNAAKSFSIPAGSTCAFLAYYTALSGGTQKGYSPLGGHQAKPATFLESTDVFTCPGHGYSNTDRVIVWDANGGSVPTSFTEGTLYYVIASATDSFQLSATSGGAAVTSTQSKQVIVQKCTPETFGSANTLDFASGGIVITGTLL